MIQERCNSTNNMLKSLLNVDPQIMENLDYPAKLTKYEMKVISEITAMLTPIEIKVSNVKHIIS